MERTDEIGGFEEEIAAFRQEVGGEIANEEALIQELSKPKKGRAFGSSLALGLLILAIIAISFQPNLLLLWLIVGLLLYSYNFLILLIPTTRGKIKPEERTALKQLGKEFEGLALFLMAKGRRLAIEVGLTLFLGGMVPLALSFSLILGVGMFFVLYFAVFAHLIDWPTSFVLVAQILFIMMFFILMMIIRPETQGEIRIANSLKGRADEARTRGRIAFILTLLTIAAAAATTSILLVGALLLPGSTLLRIIHDYPMPLSVNLLAFVLIMVAQVIVMRHFQVLSSRKMAIRLLRLRISKLRMDVLAPLDALIAEMKDRNRSGDSALLEIIKSRFYKVVIYDIVESNIFGFAPIFVVAPRLRYLLDEKVLAYLTR